MSSSSPDLKKLSLQEIYRQQVETLRREMQEEREMTLQKCHAELQRNNRNPNIYIDLARCHKSGGDHEEAIRVLQRGFRICLPSLCLYRSYIDLLNECNRTREAIAAAREATLAFPDDVGMKLKEALLLPILYDTPEEVEYYRARFTDGLRKIRDEISLDTPGARQSALSAIETHTNFYLAYQGRDDRELQIQYGGLVYQIMAANYPQWIAPLRMPPTRGKLRVGYCSSCFLVHSVSKSHVAWLQEHNQEQVLIYSYYAGTRTDFITEEVRTISSSFRHFPNDFDQMARAIRADNLHILIFLDVGMHPMMTQLAAMRLAPVQCATWGHPVTTGLRNVDYFLSSAIMEPENAQDHYSEKLICLPGIGVYYREPVIPTMLLNLTRKDFQLRDDAVVYLCSQSIFKYLPDHDDVFAQIAKRVPNAQFVFLTMNTKVNSDFQKRLDRAFSAVGLNASDYCRFLPKYLSLFDYWNLYLVSDVYLDGIGWSGCNSTFDAVACNLPIVTIPGRFLRGRHSYALLTQLGMVETIATDKAEYVEIAVHLGRDSQLRLNLVQRMISARPYLYADVRCIQALEDFFRQVADERGREDEGDSMKTH